MQGIRK